MKNKILLLFLLFSLLFTACPSPVVNPPDPPDPPDPIEYVYKWICEDSLLLSREDCRKGIHTKFIKGTEPIDICEIDHNPPDPPDPFPPKYETYSIHWIGLLPWMVMEEMAGKEIDEDIEILIEKSRRSGASYIHSFCWVGDPKSPGNQYHQFATPWLWIDGKVDFTKINPEYEIQFKFLAETCKKYDMEFRPIFFMARYNYWAFRTEYNHQGIRDFYTPKAKVIQREFIAACVEWLREVEGQNYKPTVLLINEPAHYGADEFAHVIMDWHEQQGDYVLQWTEPERLWVDGSHSEFAHAPFVGPHKCPKCDRIIGRIEYSNRPVRSESHGCSTLEGFLDSGFDMWAGSAWTHGTFNEDGSDFGSKLCDGISAFRQANTEELGIAFDYTMRESKRKNKLFNFVLFDFFPIQKAKENYRKSFILTWDWVRIGLFSVVYKEVYQ